MLSIIINIILINKQLVLNKYMNKDLKCPLVCYNYITGCYRSHVVH